VHKLIFLRQAMYGDVRCMGFGLVWVGLGHGSISSPGSGLGWVGSVIWWVGLGRWNRPTDKVMVRFSVPNSYTNYRPNTLPLLLATWCETKYYTNRQYWP